MVQKQVRRAEELGQSAGRAALTGNACRSQVATKTVAQCVEFYYTYKKHVKMSRSGTLLYGEAEAGESRAGEEEAHHKVRTSAAG